VRLYWLQASSPEARRFSPLGYGVSAKDDQDARQLLTHALSTLCAITNIGELQSDAVEEMSDLDQEHVVPNMGNHLKRGIWFPKVWGICPDVC
jgi:hypothetical protein